MLSDVRINAVAFQEGDVWVVQGIEYDVLARAKDLADLPEALVRAVMKNLCVSAHLTGEPMKGIGPAPQKFRDMFENARSRVSPIEPLPPIDHFQPEMDIRLVSAA